MQWGFYFDQTRCIGCHTCAVACKDWHDVEAGEVNWRRITSLERGTFPKIFLAYLSISCNHCAKPSCMMVCPVNAIIKRGEDGIVVVDSEKCLGKNHCKMVCKTACPYDAPQFGEDHNARMQKCDLCLDRLIENKKPICVEACPMEALDAGPLNKLTAKYRGTKDAEGFIYSLNLNPSITFKPKVNHFT